MGLQACNFEGPKSAFASGRQRQAEGSDDGGAPDAGSDGGVVYCIVADPTAAKTTCVVAETSCTISKEVDHLPLKRRGAVPPPPHAAPHQEFMDSLYGFAPHFGEFLLSCRFQLAIILCAILRYFF